MSRPVKDADDSVSDGDDDAFVSKPNCKRKLIASTHTAMEMKMSQVLEEIEDLKTIVTDATSLTKECNIPLPLIQMMRDSFQCKICHCIPSQPPIIVSRCCKVILGCEPCINSWFSGQDALTKPCPCCRHDRGYSETMTLRGLDDFLIQARELMEPVPAVRPSEENN